MKYRIDVSSYRRWCTDEISNTRFILRQLVSYDLKYRPRKISVVTERPLRLRTVILGTIFDWTTEVEQGSKRTKLVPAYRFWFHQTYPVLENIVTISIRFYSLMRQQMEFGTFHHREIKNIFKVTAVLTATTSTSVSLSLSCNSERKSARKETEVATGHTWNNTERKRQQNSTKVFALNSSSFRSSETVQNAHG